MGMKLQKMAKPRPPSQWHIPCQTGLDHALLSNEIIKTYCESMFGIGYSLNYCEVMIAQGEDEWYLTVGLLRGLVSLPCI